MVLAVPFSRQDRVVLEAQADLEAPARRQALLGRHFRKPRLDQQDGARLAFLPDQGALWTERTGRSGLTYWASLTAWAG